MKWIRSLLIALFVLHLPIHGDPKIVVVGAGLAGLTASYRLKQLGYEVEVYEARARPGGRVCTAYFEQGYEELGGKNIRDGGEAVNLRQLIGEMGLTTEEFSLDIVDGRVLFQNESYHMGKLVATGPQPTEILHQMLLEKSLVAKNLATLVDPLFSNHLPLRSLIESNIAGYMGSVASELSAKYLDVGFWDFYKMIYEAQTLPKANRYFIMESVVGGNSRVVAELANHLTGHIHYSMPLRAISYTDRFELSFDQCHILADYVILAIAASTLSDVNLKKAHIPEDQVFAIHTQHYGTNAKILIPLDKECSLPQVYNNLGDCGTWLNKMGNVMTLYYGGPNGVFNANALPHLYDRGLTELSRISSPIKPSAQKPILMKERWMTHYEGPVGVSWIHEEFSKGSYSNLSPEQFDLFNQILMIGEEPVRYVYRPVHERLFFAGEHTALFAPCTMEGAVESGQRSARLLHNSYLKLQEPLLEH